MTRVLFSLLAFVAGVGLVALPAQSQPPAGKDGKGAKGAKGGGPSVGTVVPPALLDDLKLTDEQ